MPSTQQKYSCAIAENPDHHSFASSQPPLSVAGRRHHWATAIESESQAAEKSEQTRTLDSAGDSFVEGTNSNADLD